MQAEIERNLKNMKKTPMKIFAVRLPESTHLKLKETLTLLEAERLRKKIVTLIEDTIKNKESNANE